jgi:hypothetical protein
MKAWYVAAVSVLAFFLITCIVPLSARYPRRYAEFPFGGMNSRLAKNNSRFSENNSRLVRPREFARKLLL